MLHLVSQFLVLLKKGNKYVKEGSKKSKKEGECYINKAVKCKKEGSECITRKQKRHIQSDRDQQE